MFLVAMLVSEVDMDNIIAWSSKSHRHLQARFMVSKFSGHLGSPISSSQSQVVVTTCKTLLHLLGQPYCSAPGILSSF